MKTGNRMTRINEEILKEVSQLIRGELKDPRISTITSVVKVDTTNDLKYCKIHISVLGDETQKKNVMEGLKSAEGFIRKQIASRINLRNTPEIIFVPDESIEYVIKMNKLINEVNSD